MATRKPPQQTPTENIDPDTGEIFDSSDPANNPNLGLVPVDQFDDLFGPIDDGTIQLRVLRTAPSFVDGQRILGYCGTLPHGESIEYLADRWGGGTYQIQQYLGNPKKFIQSRTVTVAGPPRIVPPFTERTPATGRPAQNAPTNIGLGEYNGLPLDGDDAAFMKRAERLLILRAVLDEKRTPDINANLVAQLVSLATQGKGSLTDLASTLDIIDRVRGDSSGGREGGATMTDLLLKGVEGFVEIVKKSPGPNPVQLPPRQPQNPPNLALAAPPEPAKEPNQVSIMETANRAVATIAAAFLEEPQYTVAETVEIIGQIVPPAAIPAIRDNAPILRNMAKLALHEKVDPEPDQDASFLLFFDRVLLTFCEPNQPTDQKGGTDDHRVTPEQ